MTTSKERIHGHDVYGPPRFTGAAPLGSSISAPTETDERGILRELMSHQIEKLDRQAVLDYQRRRSEQIKEKKEKEAESRAFENFKQSYVAAGGTESSAEAAWTTHKNEIAESAALAADQEAVQAARSRNRSVL
jgi:hypothetical protein